jgi:hypothetical protein
VELSYLRAGPTEIAGQARQMHMMDTLHQLHQHARHATTSVLENPYLMGSLLVIFCPFLLFLAIFDHFWASFFPFW